MEKWINDKEQLIVMGDLNEDVRHQEVEVWKELGLVEVVSSRYRDPPPTFNQTKKLSRPIDGIWVSAGLEIRKSGYLAFEEGCPSDHRMIWVDLNFEELFGCPWNNLSTRTPQKLKVGHPRLVEKYNNEVFKALQKYKLIEKLERLATQSKECWSQEMEDEYNCIYESQVDIRKKVEQKLRKLKTGGRPWSPRLQRYRDTIEVWSLILKKRKKIHTYSSVIRRLIHKLGLQEALKLTLNEVEQKLEEARKDYWEARKHAVKWRENFLDKLAQDVAEKMDIKKNRH